jgi:hypothetical protein
MSPPRRTEPPPPLGWKEAGALLFWLALLSVLVGLIFGPCVAERLGVGYGWGVAAVAGAVLVGLPVVLIAVLALLVLRLNRRLRSEAYEFGLVRKVVAPTEGAVVRFAEVTAWVAEPDDHPPLLREALEAARARFAALLPGFRDQPAAPVRVVCFESKRHLEAYGRKLGLPLEGLDGVYLHGRPPRILSHAEVVPRRPTEPARLQRSLFAHFFLQQAKGFLMPPWLGLGVCQVVSCAGDRGLLGRLNRKALALRARAGPEGEGWLFRTQGRLGAWLRGWRDFETYTRLARLFTYGRSLGEFLGGELSTADRLARFRAFVTELGRRDDPERVFERHFGHGFDRLLHDWARAVKAYGVGEHEPPPPPVREALLTRVIPLVEDPRADPWERTRAVREMAEGGYVLGADALIRVLAHEIDPDALVGEPQAGRPALRREAASALELISGIAAGEDVRRWREWWQSLPAAAVPVHDTSIRASPKPGPPTGSA